MEASETLDIFLRRRNRGELTAGEAGVLADRAVSSFLALSAGEGGYLRSSITLISEMTASDDAELAGIGITTLFKRLVEPLNDSFDPLASDLSDRIIAQVVDFYRHQPGCEILHRRLAEFGIASEADLLKHREQLVTRSPGAEENRLRKVLLLSRITIGADIAVTSVIAGHLRRFAPQAELVFVGPAKLREVFGGDARLGFRPVEYPRSGRVRDRLLVWSELLDAVSSEITALERDEFLIVDPDSRMTQLGLLPMTSAPDRHALFDSRRYGSAERESLGRLASRWAAERWSLKAVGPRDSSPSVALAAGPVESAAKLIDSLRRSAEATVVFISLGVGGNEKKRVSPSFEELLILALGAEAGLIIDRGSTEREGAVVDRVVELLRAKGARVVEAAEGLDDEALRRLPADVLTWSGGIGSFASLIAAADLYVGYDSAGQHIAAALGRPTLTLMVNDSSARFADRWKPTGSGMVRVIALSPDDADRKGAADLVAETMAAYRDLLTG